MQLKNKKVLVVGFGKTGRSVCDFLIHQNKPMNIKVSESRPYSELSPETKSYQNKGIEFETGGHKLPSFLDSDLIIPSPGVPPISPIQEAQKKGIPVLSEVELAFRFLKGQIIGITGSNGKSTVASLIHSILKKGGLPSYLAGNIGTPLISFVENSSPQDIFVTELSSFQLEYADKLTPAVSVVLNITPDHLDWHQNFSSYVKAKAKLVENQRKNQVTVLNRDDPYVWPLRKLGAEKVWVFSMKSQVSVGCCLKGDWIILRNKTEQKVIPIQDIPLKGIHNQENVMASVCTAHTFQIPLETIKKAIMDFKGLEHRLEKVLSLKGVDFYNDSKATNIDAALKSIMSFDKKITLILGGRDKGGNFSRLENEIIKRVKKVIVLGEAKEKITQALNKDIPVIPASSLKEAVELGFKDSNPGEVILLAPACTSFDMFDNFEHRGRVFKQEVKKLHQQIKGNKV